jgi:hypothetical protein
MTRSNFQNSRMRMKRKQSTSHFRSMEKALQRDVFLGRGPGCYKNPGNKEYRSLVKEYAAEFNRDLKRAKKAEFIDNLMFQFELQGFRFFSFSVELKEWVRALDSEVKEKIGHDIRDDRQGRKRKESPKKNTKPCLPEVKPKCVKGSQLLGNIGVELSDDKNCHHKVQDKRIQGERDYQVTNLVYHRSNPIENVMISKSTFQQSPGFCFYLVTKKTPYRSDVRNQEDNYFLLSEDMKAVNGSSLYADNKFLLGRFPDPILESAAYDILDGEWTDLKQ